MLKHRKFKSQFKSHVMYIIYHYYTQQLTIIMVLSLVWDVTAINLKIRYQYVTSTDTRSRNEFQVSALQWRHNERDFVSNHRRLKCLLNCRFRWRSKKTPNLRVAGLWAGNSPVTGQFPAQMASNAENGSIWWRHHEGLYGRNRDTKADVTTWYLWCVVCIQSSFINMAERKSTWWESVI